MNAAKWIFLSVVGVFFALVAIGAMVPGHSGTPKTLLDPSLTEQLPPLIRQVGLRCDTLSDMTLQAKTERGDVFKAICDEATSYYRYRILYTPSGHITIRPWSE